jgi:hypothetical protein
MLSDDRHKTGPPGSRAGDEEEAERQLEESDEGSFSASDPPAWGATRVGSPARDPEGSAT